MVKNLELKNSIGTSNLTEIFSWKTKNKIKPTLLVNFKENKTGSSKDWVYFSGSRFNILREKNPLRFLWDTLEVY